MRLSSHFNETLHSIRHRLTAPAQPAVSTDPYAHLSSAKRAYRKACRNRALQMAADMKRGDLVARFPR